MSLWRQLNTTMRLSRSRKLLAFFVVLTILYTLKTTIMAEKPQPSLTTIDSSFLLDGKAFQILSGAIHYFRVTPDSWDDRIKKAKVMGLNSIDIYIPWNLHEPQSGKFSSVYTKQLQMFLDLVKLNEMYVIMRPGPYICSEWDFGGLPSWLLSDKDMKVRSMYPGFTNAVSQYFGHLLPILAPYQHSRGGPIIAFQIENEYGSFGVDGDYMDFIQKEFERHGLFELFFVCDNMEGLGKYHMGDGSILQTINFMTKAEEAVERLLQLQPNKPVFVTEFWDGWFTHWGESNHYVEADRLGKTLEYLLEHNYSVNFYMFHGGTNFGFYNGANAENDGSNYQCDITSYDYDAPVSEGGDLNKHKFILFKDIIRKHTKSAPAKMAFEEGFKTGYGEIQLEFQTTLAHMLNSPDIDQTERKDVCSMENVKMNDGSTQQYGYVVYETTIRSGAKLIIENARDYVFVLLNDHLVEKVTSIQKEITVNIEAYVKTGSSHNLKILVENTGRVNYGLDLDNQRKGILGTVKLDGEVLNREWIIYSLQFDEEWVKRKADDPATKWSRVFDKEENIQPTLFRGSFEINSGIPKDTYFRLEGWFKGVVFVNGKNLGRYWQLGPQLTLYVPKEWLRVGTNNVMVFDLLGKGKVCESDSDLFCITSVDKPEVGSSKAIEFHI